MLLFIPVMIMWYNRMFFISIHLMLLFILSACNATYKCFFISIHLMLLFIVPSPNFPSPSPKFQYISCYCLSQHCSQFPVNSPNFNTSHVTVYRFPPGFTISVNRYFNTSHVTVYRGATITRTQSGKYFNTSHVTVYRIPDTDEAFEMVFQYISCYCLSNSIQPLKSLFVKFQYISCYCLSDLQIFLLHCLRNFNTSHVTVYRFPPGFTISVNRYFNTSHVTVYLNPLGI